MTMDNEATVWGAKDVAHIAMWGFLAILAATIIAFIGWYGVSTPPIDTYFPVVVQAIGPLGLVYATVALLFVNRDLAENSEAMRDLQKRIVDRQAPILRCQSASLSWEGRTYSLNLDLENAGESQCSLTKVIIGYYDVEPILDDEGHPTSVSAERVTVSEHNPNGIDRKGDYSDLILTSGEEGTFEVRLERINVDRMRDVGEGIWVEINGTEGASVRTGVSRA